MFRFKGLLVKVATKTCRYILLFGVNLCPRREKPLDHARDFD